MGLLDTTKNVTTLVARLKPLGATMAEIETTFVGFNTAAILSGSTAQEASAAFRQLAQALGSGRLQGDEFRSIAEQVPAILGAIAETMGKPVGSLKQLASEGLLTSEVIIESLDNMAKKGGKSIEQLIKSSEAQKFKDLENAIEKLNLSIGKGLLPSMMPLVKIFTFVSNQLNKIPNEFLAAAGMAVVLTTAVLGIVVAFKALVAVAALAAIPLAKFALIATGIAALGGGIYYALNGQARFNEKLTKTVDLNDKIELQQERALQLQKRIEKLRNSVFAKFKPGSQDEKIKKLEEEIANLNKSIAQDKKTLADKTAFESSPEVEKITKLTEKQEEARDEILKSLNQEKILLTESLAGNREKTLLAQEYEKLVEKIPEHAREEIKLLFDSNAELREKYTLQKKIDDAWESINNKIRGDITSGIKGLIKGTATWADMLNNVADKFLDMAINQAFYGNMMGEFTEGKGIFGFLGKILKFADGGRPPVGRPSLVGEKGPELFVPSSSGRIVPNHELGKGGGTTNVVVNVDASGTEVQGDESEGRQLGEMLSAAVQAELVRQRRPGGLLAGV